MVSRTRLRYSCSLPALFASFRSSFIGFLDILVSSVGRSFGGEVVVVLLAYRACSFLFFCIRAGSRGVEPGGRRGREICEISRRKMWDGEGV